MIELTSSLARVAPLKTYMRIWVFFRVKLSSSKASSISCVFWISERFCSSRFVKTSRSWWGSLKYSSRPCNQSCVCVWDGKGGRRGASGSAVARGPGSPRCCQEWGH